MDAILLSLAVIFVAEFGDKSQLLVLAFATRHGAAPVITGIVVAAAVIQGASVAAGAWLGSALPETPITIISGVAFLAVAAWTLRGGGDEDEEAALAREAGRARRGWIGLAAVVAATFLVGELGDKTMLATFALAARQDALMTWMGATAGMVGANLVAVAVGRRLGARLSPRAVRIGSAALFALTGLAILLSAVTSGNV